MPNMFEVHPGSILKEELQERGVSGNSLALALRINSGRISEILNEKRGITPDTALRLGRYFGNDPQFWLNLQSAHDLAVAMRQSGDRIAMEVIPAQSAA
jgi:addiction module HigA family antidote